VAAKAQLVAMVLQTQAVVVVAAQLTDFQRKERPPAEPQILEQDGYLVAHSLGEMEDRA
jgi:hypothetical protein